MLPKLELVMRTYKQGSHYGYLIVLLSVSFALIGCTAANTRIASVGPVTTWIQQNAIPLKTVEPGGSDADLQPLQSLVGNASIVGLGEETHGTHEFFTMKARLVEFLVSRMGFTTFIMENNWGTSRLIDAYINGGQGNVEDVMRMSLFFSWQTQEYRDMLEWMRAYNTDATHTTKIHFVGMDCQGVSQGDFDEVENYVRAVDPQQAAHIQNLYADIIARGIAGRYTIYPQLAAETKQQYQDQAQQVYDLLHAHQQAYENRSSPQAFALALQNARIIVQFTTYANQNSQDESLARYIQRDAFMAENVAWIHDHAAGSHPKMIVWPHDVHIANNPSYYYTGYAPKGTENLGGFLRTWFKQSYLPIATSLYQGTFNTYQCIRVTTDTAGTAGDDTYTYTLRNVAIPIYMLDLRKTQPGPGTDCANGPYTFLPLYLGVYYLSIPGAL